MTLLNDGSKPKPVLLSSAPTTSWPSSIEFDQDLTIRGLGGCFLRLYRGFISFGIWRRAQIYNPSTRQHVILPAPESSVIAESGSSIVFFMGHDPLNDRYKLLNIVIQTPEDLQHIRSEYWVFVFEAGGSWKRIAEEFHPHLPDPFHELNMNGVVYYLAWTDIRTCVLVSFNFRYEEFNMLQVPRRVGDVLTRRMKRITLINYGGKIAVFDYTYLKKACLVDIWVVEDWRKKEWSMTTIFLKPTQMHLVTTNKMRAKGTSLKDKVILVPRKMIYPFHILCNDFQINDLKKIEVKGIPDRWFNKPETKYFDMDFMVVSESMKYLET